MHNRISKKENAQDNLHFVLCPGKSPRPTSHHAKEIVLSMDQKSQYFNENLLAIVNCFNPRSVITLRYSNNNNEDLPAYYYDVLKADKYSIPIPLFFSSLGISARKAFPEDLTSLRHDPDARAAIYEALVYESFGDLTEFKISQKEPKTKNK